MVGARDAMSRLNFLNYNHKRIIAHSKRTLIISLTGASVSVFRVWLVNELIMFQTCRLENS